MADFRSQRRPGRNEVHPWLDRILAKTETVVLVIFLGTMVVLAFLQVVLRNFFGTGLIWGDTLVRHMVLWAGFIGGALAAFEGRHISIDALTKYLSPRLQECRRRSHQSLCRRGLLLSRRRLMDVPVR